MTVKAAPDERTIARAVRANAMPFDASPDALVARDPTLLLQEAQQPFPERATLRDDLLATNQRLISYVGALETMIARPNAPRTRRKARSPKAAGAPDTRKVSTN